MQRMVYHILSQECIAERVWKMRLGGPTDGICAGQFVDLRIPAHYLRRPISVCDVEEGVLTIIYKVVGEGTSLLSTLPIGTSMDVLIQLGNGYDLRRAGDSPLLVGGGVGVPPLYLLAKRLREEGKDVQVVLGFNTKSEVFMEDAFRSLGCSVRVATADGSYGAKGFVTNCLPSTYSYYYACGPLPMLRALVDKAGMDGELSMEERMGCGFGICMGCTIETRHGYKRVCKDGPVFAVGDLFLR